MRQIATNEILTLNKMLEMEVNALSIAKAGMKVIEDDELKKLTRSGIQAAEARIRGLQQFIGENQITKTEGVQ